jgi:hypothetical protein
MFTMKIFFKNYLFTSHKYLILLGVLLVIFIIFHAVTYFFITSKVMNIIPPYSVGDLSRMSYQTESMHSRKYETLLTKTHLEGVDYRHQPIDILSVGDSFSNGGGGGLNPYYQDYLATKYGYNVLNIRPFSDFQEGYLETILILLNSGYLDTIKPKIILLEFGSRSFISHFSGPFNWSITLPKSSIQKQISQMKSNDFVHQIPSNIFFINTGNYKTYINRLKLRSKPCLGSGPCRLSLNKTFFSVSRGDALYFYRDDLKNISQFTPEAVSNAHKNLNRLSKLLAAKNIKLYVMPIVDKYDLYYPYLANKSSYPQNPIFDYWRPLNKDYTFIDTKMILSQPLSRGQKDIFYADDTHWSYKASDIITNETTFLHLN